MRLLPVLMLLFAMLVPGETPAWVAKSNRNTQLLLDVMARYSPEDAASSGVTGLDEKISEPTAEIRERERRDLREVRKQLEGRFASEQDPLVKQDLTILIGNIDHNLRSSELEERLLLPYS